MFLFYFLVVLLCGLCVSQETNLGYELNIGHAIDVFANYGDLSQVTQVISSDYDEEDDEDLQGSATQPFSERNIKIFENSTSSITTNEYLEDNMSVLLCDTYNDLLNVYFQDFVVEGTDKPWKVFMGDWLPSAVMRTFGIVHETTQDSCCYVLLKLSKPHVVATVDDLTDVDVKDYVKEAMDDLNGTDAAELRKFMKNYGTHYIHSYTTGNFIYQVFKFKRYGYSLLKARLKKRNSPTQNLRWNFASIFLQQVGDIRVASGNKTIERWAKSILLDSQYQYSRPTLLKLYYNPFLVQKLSDLLDSGALLAMNLKTLKPIFTNKTVGDYFDEVLRNDLQLWEVNV